MASYKVCKLSGKNPWKSWVMRSMGCSAPVGWLVHFILNSLMCNQTKSQADISHAHTNVPGRKQTWFSVR